MTCSPATNTVDLMLTTQTRLSALSAAEVGLLDELGAYQGRLLRQLYAYTAAHGGKPIEHKTAFCHKHRLSSRFFNALRVMLQGSIGSVRELLAQHLADLRATETALGKKLAALDKKFTEIAADRLRVSFKQFQVWKGQHAKARHRLLRIRVKIAAAERRLAAPVPGIGFGSRKLFKKQYLLQENGYASHDEWLKDWRAARSHQVFFLGSSDETGGNQQCTLLTEENGFFALRIRIPDTLLSSGQDKYLWLRGLQFEFQAEALRAALSRGQALTWRLHRDARGWRALVSFSRPATALQTLSVQYGALGIDFNVDHFAVTEVDLHGNLRESWRFDFAADPEHSSGQRKASLSEALSQVVALALARQLPLVREDLDFSQKKKQISAMSPAQARRLSGLAYSQYVQLLESKCARLGVQLHKVNPAYTSVAGRVKYASKRGKSVHGAAAGVIARCGMGYRERPPRQGAQRVPSQGATLAIPAPARKAGVKRGVLWRAWAMLLGKHLREHWLATRGRRRGVRKAGPAVGCGIPAHRQVETTVRSAKQHLLNAKYEQVCAI